MNGRIRAEDIETPALLLDMDILESNIRKMSEFMKGKHARLRPHFKTDKCPKISHMQLEAGAKGITCSKCGEAEVLAQAGVKDILIANQIADPAKLLRVAGMAKSGARMTVLVDSEEGVEDVSNAAAQCGTEINVLIEVDVGMGRCGVNTPEEVYAIAQKALAAPGVVFNGLQAYEGHLGHIPEEEKRRKGVALMVDKITKIKAYLNDRGIEINEISGGGTGTYYITGDNTIWTEIQAGSYLFMDLEYDKLGLTFENALTVLTTVIHKRDGVAVTDAGLKTCGTDQGLPVIKGYPGITVVLNEEHGILKDSCNELKLKQKVEYVPGHCCSTVNLNDSYYCVRNGFLEAVWPILGRGKSR